MTSVTSVVNRSGLRRDSPRGLVVACVTLVTFTDLVAYSIAVPVLPDYVRRFGASPATIGFLFGSFGLTLLAVAIPMGAVSDRIGRKGPLVLATVLLALSTLAFAFADSLAMLFGARLLQGVADGVTWVVGFALIADLYGPDERGSMMGIVMSATNLGVIVGPSLGGWLYELGGIRLPFLVVAAAAALTAVAFLLIRIPDRKAVQARADDPRPQTPGHHDVRHRRRSGVGYVRDARTRPAARARITISVGASTHRVDVRRGSGRVGDRSSVLRSPERSLGRAPTDGGRTRGRRAVAADPECPDRLAFHDGVDGDRVRRPSASL